MAVTEQDLALAYKLAQQQGGAIRIENGSITIVPQQDGNSSGQGKKSRPAKKLPKVIESEQIDILLSSFEKEHPTGRGLRDISQLRDKTMVETMLRAGLRVSEVCDLSPADVNLSKGDIFIQLGKGRKDRHVPIGPALIKSLRAWAEVRPESPYFFATNKGTRVAPRHLNAVLHRVSTESGVFIQDGHEQKPVHNHTFRHCYATDLLSKGLNIREVQEALGHASIATTQRYTHVSMKELDKKIKALG